MLESARLERHFWLTQGMARSVGVDLNAALKSGRMPRPDYDATIAACFMCGRSEDCMTWMARQGAGAERPPAYCAIRHEIEKLREQPQRA
ncbi:hypothetical protein HA397_24385 [Escherichia coli]|nr:hypothetical protein [Escherichia coli]